MNIAPQNIENMLKADPFISQVMVYGDRKPYPVALITLNADEVAKFAREQGIVAGDATVVVTDHPSIATQLPGAEIGITGLAPAGITYQASSGGDFRDGITMCAGYGNDTVTIDGTHERSGVRTITTLNTGLGDDTVTVNLTAGQDGFFVLNTQGPYNEFWSYTDRDTVDATASTLPLVIFGGQGDDTIRGGQGSDLIFGDRGRVLYFATGLPTSAVADAALAATEASAASVLGHGGHLDKTDGVVRPVGLAISVDRTIGGVDTIYGQGGDDVLIGGVSSDYLDGGTGLNRLDGGHGVDTAAFTGSSRGLRVDLASTAPQGRAGAADLLRGIENVAAAHAREARISGDAGPNYLSAGRSSRIDGRAGDDDLQIGPGGRMFGGPGSDTLDGGVGPSPHAPAPARRFECGTGGDDASFMRLDDLVREDCETIDPEGIGANAFVKLVERPRSHESFATLRYGCYIEDDCPLEIVARLGSSRGRVVGVTRVRIPYDRHGVVDHDYELRLNAAGRAVLRTRGRMRVFVYYREGPYGAFPGYTPREGFSAILRAEGARPG
jgi:Ca2+-binding RTX toxin-like protein